jgi:hypothetical protein
MLDKIFKLFITKIMSSAAAAAAAAVAQQLGLFLLIS